MQLDALLDMGPIRPGRETWAHPRRMMASDGNSYVVKIRNGADSKSFFNEFVASNIALRVGLPAAEPVVIHLGAELIGRSPDLKDAGIEPGAYYATRYLDDACAISDEQGLVVQPSSIANLEDVPALVIFDIFVHNTDRHGGNTLLVPSGGARYRYLLIDHGHCFGGPDWGPDGASDLAYELAGVTWSTDGVTGESDFAAPAALMAGLGEADIDAARDGLPGEWDVPAEDYKALRGSMSSRRRDPMLDTVRANRPIFAGWRRAADRGRGSA